MNHSSGMTLIELIVTISVLAVVATVAMPSILSQLASMEAKRIRADLKRSLSTAKAESYVRRQDLIGCLTNVAGRCDKNGSQQFVIFIDSNDNKHFDSGIDTLIKTQALNPKYATLHLRAGKRHHTKFFGDTGLPRGHFGHIKYCPIASSNTHTSDHRYQISFNKNGIIKFKPHASHDSGCGQ